jgi:hypothetical protein
MVVTSGLYHPVIPAFAGTTKPMPRSIKLIQDIVMKIHVWIWFGLFLLTGCDVVHHNKVASLTNTDIHHEKSPKLSAKSIEKPKEEVIPPVSGPLAYPISPIALDNDASTPRGLPMAFNGSGGGRKEPIIIQGLDSQMMHGLIHWNHIAIDASGIDHKPPPVGIKTIPIGGEQLGPARAARAMAIVHIAIFEALNAIEQKYESYLGLPKAEAGTSSRAALAQAAYETLIAMFPSQTASFAEDLANDLSNIPNGNSKDRGIALGHLAATTILNLRDNDGSNHAEPIIGVDYFPTDAPGEWRKDPISNKPIAMGADWYQVLPFVIEAASQFRIAPPPPLDSHEYAVAFNEVKRLGGNGLTTPTERNEDQTETGIYWAYDGTPSLCAPPRLYNQVALKIAEIMESDFMEVARLLALINVGLADSALAIWESKFFYKFWRPVTAIRESEPGTGPSGLGDGNNETMGDISFWPLGAPASNSSDPNFTPPFPSYPSGHAGFGGTLFQILRRFYETDDIAFTFVSEELNGKTEDRNGIIRPLVPRSFDNLSEAELENGLSRIYLGIHFRFDIDEGIEIGRDVGNYVFDHLFLPKN